MADNPLYNRRPRGARDGWIAALLLFLSICFLTSIVISGPEMGWEFAGPICLAGFAAFSFSIGFAISGLRQKAFYFERSRFRDSATARVFSLVPSLPFDLKLKTSTTLLVILAVVAGYLLSPPVAAWLVFRIAPSKTAIACLETIYAPAGMLYAACPPYRKIMKAQYRLLGLDGFGE